MVVFLFSLAWGLISLPLFVVLENDLYATGICFLGLSIWIYLLHHQGKLERYLANEHSNYIQARNGFACQRCGFEILKPIKNQNKDGEPILYHCTDCNVLWFVGSVDRSTA